MLPDVIIILSLDALIPTSQRQLTMFADAESNSPKYRLLRHSID